MTDIERVRGECARFLDDGLASSALPLAQIVCELSGREPSDLQLLARSFFENRQYDNAVRTANEILVLSPYDNEALATAMRASFEMGNCRDCNRFALRALEREPQNVRALCYVARCAEVFGDRGKATDCYKNALRTDPFCAEAVEALVDRYLVSVTELNAFLDTLVFPDGAEAVRATYKARVQGEPPKSGSALGVPRAVALLQKAHREYRCNNLRLALVHTTELVEVDPFNREGVCLHLSVLVDLKATPQLFEQAHMLSRNKLRAELAVYAIGCFYFSLANYERAGRYFSRATELDCFFAEAWVAYGHCYAKLEEGEQALSAYRRAMDFFPGLHHCSMLVGMQYSRIQQWPLAMCFFDESLKQSPNDPLVLNEIGVLYLRTSRLADALEFFKRAYHSLPNAENPSEHCDCIIFNLATALRKSGDYAGAIEYYNQYIRCRPNARHGHCAVGFAHHLAGNYKSAISHYHTSLSIKPDAFCRDMLDRALTADFGHNVGGDAWGPSDEIGSPSPDEVSFSTITRPFRSDSAQNDSSVASPSALSVGRSLTF